MPPAAGEMARRIAAFDWSATPLGTPDTWSPALHTTLRIVLASRFPHILWWGRDYIQFYNDAYIPIPGVKHPDRALGQPARECWAEIWHVIGPLIDRPFLGGPATWDDDIQLVIDRHGFLEETHFTIAYSPVPDDSAPGGIGGVLATVHEITEKVVGERRVSVLRDLGARAGEAKTAEEACGIAALTLARHGKDIPFALLYLIDPRDDQARLAGAAGVDSGLEISPLVVSLASEGRWPIAEALRSGRVEPVEHLRERFASIPQGPWPDPPHTGVVIAIPSNKPNTPAGLLLAGVSARLALDESYVAFFELVRTQLATAIANARAYEEERHRAEALAEIDRAKTAFFTNISHEFRTPLTLLQGPLEDTLAQRHGPVPPRVAQALTVAQRNSLRLLKLVNTLLDFSRIEAGRMAARYEPVDLAGFTAELAAVFRAAIERAGMRLIVSCPPLSEPTFVDREMWEKIVLNLLSNAFKFTLRGEIDVRVQAVDGCAELSVRDTGVGIRAEELPHMFERFHRVHGSAGRTHEGTGIGLALVRELAQLHGGTAAVSSTVGEGSIFTVRIPFGSSHLDQRQVSDRMASTRIESSAYLQEALRWLPGASVSEDLEEIDSSLIDPAISSAIAPAAESERATVLLVDDNADMRGYVGRLLADRFCVQLAGDGIEALEAIRARRPDLVLSDIMMPRLDGLQLLAALRSDPDTADLPVILLSARAGEDARVEGMQAGADDYLVKPFSARELVARVDAHLKMARTRRDADHALRARTAQFETLFNRAPLGIFVVDAQLRMREVNPIAMPMFRDVAGGVIGRDFGEVVRVLWERSYADELVQTFRHILDTGESHYAAERGELRADRGVIEYYEWRIDRITLPDGGYGVVCYFRDISERVHARVLLEQQANELHEANRAKDEFLAMLGHELRNPLSPIVTALELMRLRGEPSRERDIIERQVAHLNRLVDDLLDVSRIARGAIDLVRQPMEIAEPIQRAIEMASPLLEQRRHALDVDVPREGLGVIADGGRIAQVVCNLLTNAAKYSDEGSRIRLRAFRENAWIKIAVQDEGIGIRPDMLEAIFGLFVQERQGADRAAGGLGLGLAIARNLARLHGGTIGVTSDGPGRGSEFTVALPAREIQALRVPAAQQPGRALDRTGKRVLVVDDNGDTAAMMKLLLEGFGCTVAIAKDGPSALRLAESFVPEVALLDIGLPVMDGYELGQRLREVHKGTTPLQLVACTGYGRDTDRMRSTAAGFDAHLVKPVNAEVLRRFVN
ncbi:MAG TPA: ATP-binding protein [Casimicrobiaceae bacterium]|nr:ATP-binding protein [Casimicrobiaceae bacterium]